MTPTERISLDFSDLLGIEFECKCGTLMIYSPAKWSPNTMGCPGCGEEGWVRDSADLALVQRFAQDLKRLVAVNGVVSPRFTIRLQIARPDLTPQAAADR
jgi:hypothetical protein